MGYNLGFTEDAIADIEHLKKRRQRYMRSGKRPLLLRSFRPLAIITINNFY